MSVQCDSMNVKDKKIYSFFAAENESMTDSGVDSEPSPSSPDSDARSASPRLMTLLRRSASPSGMTLLRRSASPSGMTLLRRSASPSGMTLLRRSASPAACAVIRRSEPAAATTAILLNTWRSAEVSSAAAATSATEEDDDDEEEEEEEKITLYRSEEDCEHPSSSILRLENATSSNVRLENPSSAPSVSLENASSSSSSSCSQLESLETVEEKMETVEALLSLSDSSRSPLASPEKQSGQPPGTGKTKNGERGTRFGLSAYVLRTTLLPPTIFKDDLDGLLVL
jgi:hypothetical protein